MQSGVNVCVMQSVVNVVCGGCSLVLSVCDAVWCYVCVMQSGGSVV